ncbi:hypothetical protein BU16DRAFT_618710 [Lophium mytilinum]|uniref:Uncharacterized protein n=1 Tax=Lophium mytilinum TaxID=390894 RepID=A0A6A6QSH5_9PEZI|nr:hypothetical protein BU16DRAFT_618710 [Lophium mytilinum]
MDSQRDTEYIGYKPLPLDVHHIELNPKRLSPIFRTSASENFTEINEKPKVALVRSLWLALWRCGIHLLAMAVTMCLLALYVRKIYLADYGGKNQAIILNGFQFVAKAHELILLASLSDIVLDEMRRRLSGTKGVPFGLLTSGYQLTKLNYLFSNEFRSTLPIRPLLVVSVGVAYLLAAIANPVSAIVALPKLNYWPVEDPFNGSDDLLYLTATSEQIWPSKVNASLLPSDRCLRRGANSRRQCPTTNINEIKEWQEGYVRGRMWANVTIVDNESGALRYLSSDVWTQQMLPPYLTDIGDEVDVQNATYASEMSWFGWASGTSVTHLVATDLANFWRYAWKSSYPRLRGDDGGPAPLRLDMTAKMADSKTPETSANILKPLVGVECAWYDKDDPKVAFPFGHLGIRNDEVWQVPQSALDLGKNFTGKQTQFFWVPIDEHAASSTRGNASIGGIFFVPVDIFDHTDPKNPKYLESSYSIIPCTITAYWLPGIMWLETRKDLFVHQAWDSPADAAAALDITAAFPTTARHIEIGTDWADALNVPSDGTENTLVGDLADIFLVDSEFNGRVMAPRGGYKALPTRMISTSISMLLSDALSLIGRGTGVFIVHDGPGVKKASQTDLTFRSRHQYPLPQLEADSLENGWMRLQVRVRRFGYAWSFKTVTPTL